MRSTFKSSVLPQKERPKKNSSVPVMCRITIDGTIAQFGYRATFIPTCGTSRATELREKYRGLETNHFLDKIRVGINAKYKEIAERDNYVTAEKVKRMPSWVWRCGTGNAGSLCPA